MRTIPKRLAVFGGMLLVPLAGCVNLTGPAPGPVSPLAVNTTSTPGQPKPPPELPPGESARICMATAASLEAGDKDTDAIVMYDRARQLDPRNMDQATRHIAILFDRQGQFDKARVEFGRALQTAPHDPDLLNDLGYSYYNQGLWDEAEKTLRLALGYDSKHARAWVNLGMTLAQKQDYDGALAAFEKAVPPAQAYCNVAFILASQGKREEARMSYEAALRLDPGLQLARAAMTRLDRPESEPRTPPSRPAAVGPAHTTAARPAAPPPADPPIYVDPSAPPAPTSVGTSVTSENVSPE